MALEGTFNTIADLDPANPGPADIKSAGDDHLRGIKKTLRNSFAGFGGAILVTGVEGGTAVAGTLTPATTLPDYADKMLVVFSPAVNSTGAYTMNISGLGAKAVKSVTGAALALGDLIVGQEYLMIYNGTEFRLVGVTKNFIDQLTFAASGIPGQTGNAAKFLTTDGASAGWAGIDLRGEPVSNKGNSGTAAQVINYADGEGQTLTSTGAFVLSATGFPAGRIAGILVRLINGGANGFSTTGINIIKSDGSLTTTFSSSGIILQTIGTDFLLLLSFGDGAVYMKVAR